MKLLLPLLPCLFWLSCLVPKKKELLPSPPGYDLNAPMKLVMHEDLDEISGIRVDEKTGLIVAVNDEEGKLYRLNEEGKKQGKAFKFAKKGDFEELDFDGTFWYAVTSTGEIHRVANAFTDSFSTSVFPFTEKGVEFETIAYDRARNKLFILTKVAGGLMEGKIPAYTLDTTTRSFSYDPAYSPDTASIARLSGKKKTTFRPTSAAFHPRTGELFIISVNDRLLVIMKDGEVKQVYKLAKATFRQPEGICFSANGDLYISNEAQDATGNILVFKYDASKVP